MAQDPHRQLVAVELNAFHETGALGDILEGARIGDPTVVLDANGTELFERVPLTTGAASGHTDVALDPAVGSILMSVTPEAPWDRDAILEKARSAANDLIPGGLSPDFVEQFVAYSYPKIGVQFLLHGEEKLLLDALSLREVPPATDRPPDEPPSHHERWSFIGELTPEEREDRERHHAERVEANQRVPHRDQVDPALIARGQFAPPPGGGGGGEDDRGGDDGPIGGGGGVGAGGGGNANPAPPAGPDQRNLHFSSLAATHQTCYEKSAQQTSEWCVAASIEMLLGFYRYEYTQERIAQDLGLGTAANPSALPNANWSSVVTEIETLTSDALDATLVIQPSSDPIGAWQTFRTEILANRPAISFVAGHSRTVAGYYIAQSGGIDYQGLVVYDPYTPGTGPSYEQVRFPRYKAAFTAKVPIV